MTRNTHKRELIPFSSPPVSYGPGQHSAGPGPLLYSTTGAATAQSQAEARSNAIGVEGASIGGICLRIAGAPR